MDNRPIWERCEFVESEIERTKKRIEEIQKTARQAFGISELWDCGILCRGKKQKILDAGPRSLDKLKVEFDELTTKLEAYEKEYEKFRADYWKRPGAEG